MGNPETANHINGTDDSVPISNPVLDELRYTDRGEDKQHVILGLERRYRAMQFFMGNEGLEEGQQATKNQKRWRDVDEQFRRHISAILATKRKDKTTGNEYYLYPDADSAWKRFEEWKTKAISKQQRDAMTMNKDEFVELFKATREYLDSVDKAIHEDVQIRLGEIKNAERVYGEQTPNNYERLKDEGITIKINEQALEDLRNRTKLDDGDPDKIRINGTPPILEQLKTERILNIEGLGNSKVSLAIHDSFDHMWLMSQLEKNGVLERYSDFLKKIGNPLWRNVFGREGEVVASIGFSYRYSDVAEDNLTYFNFEQIKNMLEKGIARGQDEAWSSNDQSQIPNIQAALEIINGFSDFQKERFVFSFSNYVVEYLEQIRKHGNVKVQNEEGDFVDKLRPVDPEMLAFFVESFNLLSDTEYKSENFLIELELMIEEKLKEAIEGTGPAEFKIIISDIHGDSPDTQNNPKAAWFRRNLGFSATRNKIG